MSDLGKVYESSAAFAQTDIWTDSFTVQDHVYGLEHGSVGITSSPTWVSDMLNEELEEQKPVIRRLIRENPTMNEQEILWKLTLDLAAERSKIMRPLFDREGPSKGRFSVQVPIYEYRNAERMVEAALQVHALAPNMQVKIPSTTAGLAAIEEAIYRGVSVMATSCVSVSQAIEVGEAVERALNRRVQEGLPIDQIHPVVALLLGVQDEWLSAYADKSGICLDPDACNWAGVAVAKKTYKIYQEKGYRTRILIAWYRNLHHWKEFIGGDLIMTIPAGWQKRYACMDLEIRDYMSDPVDPEILRWLNKLEPFRRGYEEGALKVEDFETFEPVICVLRRFIEVYQRAVFQVRDIMIPDPKK